MQRTAHSTNKIRNLMITLSYDGSGYHGWQVQKNAISVQAVFQNSLEKTIKEKVNIKGCSRTDTGVHANTYIVNFKTLSKIKCDHLIHALNRSLPNDIAVTNCVEVSMDFHARYSCIGKEYVYKIWNNNIRNPFLNNRALHYWYPLNIDILNDAAKMYTGTHDFTSFATLDKRETKNMIRTVETFSIHKYGDLIEIKVKADGFLYNMVRIMIGTLLRIAQGKFTKEDIPRIIESKNRKNAGPTAPAHGLYLNHVFYENF